MKGKGMKKIGIIFAAALAICLCFAMTGCGSSQKVELQVYAANSLTKAMNEVQELYTSENKNITFADTQYLSSGELNEKLAGGAYADILISASSSKMDAANEKGLIKADTRFDMFKNDLVIVASSNSSLTNVTLADVATGNYTVAIGDASVPAGNYANQALSTVGCFDNGTGKVGSANTGVAATGSNGYEGTALEGKVNLQSSVGNVCKQVSSGASELAFVYTSDVYRFDGVKIVGTVPADTHKAIKYPCAITSQSKNASEAQKFIDWATTNEKAIAVWQKWGFELIK